MNVDQMALLPAYLAAGTAVLALLTDLFAARLVVAVTALGALATAIGSPLAGNHRAFCLAGTTTCSLVTDRGTGVVAAVFSDGDGEAIDEWARAAGPSSHEEARIMGAHWGVVF